MTPEDLEQITSIVASHVDRAVTEIRASQDRAVTELRASQDRAVEFIAHEISSTREEIISRVGQRFDSVDRRLERAENQLHVLTLQNAGMSKSLTDAERLDSSTAATLAAQQNAITELYRQVADLKRQRPQQ